MSELISKAWQSAEPYLPQIVSIITIFGAFLAAIKFLWKPKVNLIYGMEAPRGYEFSYKNYNINIICQRLYIENIGKKSGENIEIIFDSESSDLKIRPPCKFEIYKDKKDVFVIKIECLAPKSIVNIDIINLNINVSRLVSISNKETTINRVSYSESRNETLSEILNKLFRICFLYALFLFTLEYVKIYFT